MNTSTKAALPPPSIGSADDGGLGHNDLVDTSPGASTFVLVGPIPKANRGDRVTVFWDGKEVKTYDIMEADLGKTFPIPVPNAMIAAVNDGEKVLTYAVHYNQGGGDDFSEPPVIITVKRSVPGGLDPHPETPHNENLGPLIISPNPVPPDATEVTVDVPLWKNAAKGDQAAVSWNGAMFFPALLPDAPFPQTVRVTLTAMDLITAGVGPKVPVTWGVHDIVANWSFWAEAVEVDVRVEDPGLLVAPRVGSKEQPWTKIDLAALAGNALDVFTPNYQDATKDDLVVVHAHGIALDGSKVTFDSEPQRTEQPEFGMTFKVPNAKVAELAGGEVRTWYSVTGKSESHSVWLKVVGTVQRDFPAPQVREAQDSNGDNVADWLDPDDARPDAHVTIDYPTMARDDVVTLFLEGTTSSGAPVKLIYLQEQVGAPAPIIATVPHPDILRFLGGQMDVYYQVIPHSRRPLFVRAMGEPESEHLALRVHHADATKPPPAPVVTDEKGVVIPEGGILPLPAASAFSKANYDYAIGDEVTYSWIGFISSQTHTYRVDADGPLPDVAGVVFLEENKGGMVTASYSVRRGGLDPAEFSEKLTFKMIPYTEDFEGVREAITPPGGTLHVEGMIIRADRNLEVRPKAPEPNNSRHVRISGFTKMTISFNTTLREVRFDLQLPGFGELVPVEAWDYGGRVVDRVMVIAGDPWKTIILKSSNKSIKQVTFTSSNNGAYVDNFLLTE